MENRNTNQSNETHDHLDLQLSLRQPSSAEPEAGTTLNLETHRSSLRLPPSAEAEAKASTVNSPGTTRSSLCLPPSAEAEASTVNSPGTTRNLMPPPSAEAEASTVNSLNTPATMPPPSAEPGTVNSLNTPATTCNLETHRSSLRLSPSASLRLPPSAEAKASTVKSPNTPGTTRNLETHRSSLRRCNSRPKMGKITPPYPWSTDRRAMVHTLNHLKLNRILIITGEVRCRRCQRQYEIQYEVVSKFTEIASFVETNKNSFHDRAPSSWMNPNFPTCRFCGLENGARPVIPNEWRKINWLFLLLGQMLGFLNLNHLKYFCSHTSNHRTGAKNRLLYLTYITLCHQVDPSGRFRRN